MQKQPMMRNLVGRDDPGTPNITPINHGMTHKRYGMELQKRKHPSRA